MTAAQFRTGKSYRDENFPVASLLIVQRLRAPILAFYAFARTADDVADNPVLSPVEKLRFLDSLENSLMGRSRAEPEGVELRQLLAAHRLDPIHARELLEAFRKDSMKKRYRDWDELMDYCRYSAMPVGRFVLDAHGESRHCWAASDALCAALQIINHLQDCREDFRSLDRVYLPADALAKAGANVEDLMAHEATPALHRCLAALAHRTRELLDRGKFLAGMVQSTRLSLEIAVIEKLARRQLAAILQRDPLRENVRIGAVQTASASVAGLAEGAIRRMAHPQAESGQQSEAAKRASGSSFYAAMRILPRGKRDAMLEIYGYCRAVDDIADGEGARPARLKALDAWRRNLDILYSGEPPLRLNGLALAVRRFDLPKRDFFAVIDGMEMDVREDIRAPGIATLDLYCDRVASAVGRLSVRVFGVDDENGEVLAHHLGRALQLTNILRDVDEDAGIGRLYLPREALDMAGIAVAAPQDVLSDSRIGIVCDFLAGRAREHYENAYNIMSRVPRHAVRAPRVMADVYAAVLDALSERGWAAPRARVKLPRSKLAGILMRRALL